MTDKAPELVRKPTVPIHWVGEPERCCANCEHFERDATSKTHGFCHNGISGRARAHLRDSCDRGWYPDVERFPLEKRYHG